MIDASNFHRWKKDPTTIQLFEGLQSLRDQINEQLIDAHVILEPDSRVHLARLIGMREGLDTVLQIEVDDLIEEIDEDEDTPNSL